MWWFCRFLTAHGHTDVLSSQILVVICGGLRWCVVVCGGLWWFMVICGGLSFSHTPRSNPIFQLAPSRFTPNALLRQCLGDRLINGLIVMRSWIMHLHRNTQRLSAFTKRNTVVPATPGHRWFRGKMAVRGRWPLVTGNGQMHHYVKSNIRQHIFHSKCTTL